MHGRCYVKMQENVKARVRDKAVDMETEKVNHSTSIASLLCVPEQKWTLCNLKIIKYV